MSFDALLQTGRIYEMPLGLGRHYRRLDGRDVDGTYCGTQKEDR